MNPRKGYWGKYVFFSSLSIFTALGNMGVIYTINRIIKNYFTNTQVEFKLYLFYFSLALCLFFTCRWIVSLSIIRFTQKLLRKTRVEVLKMVLRSSFGALRRNKARVYSILTRDTDTVVNASINSVDILTNTVIITICFIYMGIVSWKLLSCMIVLTIFTLIIYFLSEKRARKLFLKAMAHNDTFVRYLNEILSGFKEITLERKKGMEIKDTKMRPAIEGASMLYQKAQINFLNNRIIGQIAFYSFVGLLLLFLGEKFGITKVVVVNFVFLVLYIWGPIETVVLMIPGLSNANMALKRINDLKEEMKEDDTEKEQGPLVGTFNNLILQDISYEYQAPMGGDAERIFGIGPVDFHIDAGEIVFISGGNGSGKTTLINVLTGLFHRDKGRIIVNDLVVEKSRITDYRLLFSPIFSDFHLFDECYGIQDIDEEKVGEYLKILEIDGKVRLEGKRFSTIDLSTGQRKRLALFNAMLERKPILILDEFAAEQDVQFKRKFYKEILQYIRNEGFTIIAITHDDAYYDCADRLYKMDSGKLFAVNSEKNYRIAGIHHD
jgi:putative ATP-binding cassette transporter